MNAHTPRKSFAIGQVWQERRPYPEENLVRIDAITDHPLSPVIGRHTAVKSMVSCYALNGQHEPVSETDDFLSDSDLVTLIEAPRRLDWDADPESGQ
jgi:hypothetical protein